MSDKQNQSGEKTVTLDYALLGTQIGNYKIISVLGEGGFGTVYKARDVKLGRDVALKFIIGPSDKRRKELFEREAKVLAALGKHPSIVQIHEWGEYKGQTYFALELVESSAEKMLEKSPDGIPTATAIQIAAETAEGLAHAHEQGVIHRDIKPANILLESDRRVKVADFGLARFYESDEKSRSGAISGSPSYMSPEQAAGEDVDHRSDIFSLGVTLYELLCGRKMFKGATFSETLERLRKNKRTPLHKCRPDLPEAVLDIVEKATAHNPAKRYQSANEMAQELRDVFVLDDAKRTRIQWLTSPSVKARTVRWIILAVCIMTIVVMILTGGGGRSDGESLAQADMMLDKGELETAEELYLTYLADDAIEDPDKGRYGLGYSLLLQGKTEEGTTEFEKVTDKSLRTEGTAAVAYHANGENARDTLEASLATVISAYPDALLGALDIAAEQYESALQRLENIDSRLFNFNWQRAQYLQKLGKAYYHTGDDENALRVFSQIPETSPRMMVTFAREYSERIRSRMDAQRRTDIMQQVSDIKELMKEQEYKPLSEEELWTSRPIRICLLPADPGTSWLIKRSGLADVLARELGNGLAKKTRMEQVDRDLIDLVLAEQELSAQLSSDTGRLRLGRILGARLQIKCSFGWVLNEDLLYTKVTDTETTLEVPVDRVDIPPYIDLDMLIDQLCNSITAAVRNRYPIRGRVYEGESGVEIDVGSSVGVTKDMRFSVYSLPDKGYLLEEKAVVVDGPVGNRTAGVRLDGFTADVIPDGGWYIIEERTEL